MFRAPESEIKWGQTLAGQRQFALPQQSENLIGYDCLIRTLKAQTKRLLLSITFVTQNTNTSPDMRTRWLFTNTPGKQKVLLFTHLTRWTASRDATTHRWKFISSIKEVPFNAHVVFYKTLKPPTRLSSITFYNNCSTKRTAFESAISFCSWQNMEVERRVNKQTCHTTKSAHT